MVRQSKQFVNLQDNAYVWQIFRNGNYDDEKGFPPTGWLAAKTKMEAQVANNMRVKAAIAWHFRHTLVKCWCTEEIKMRCFDGAGADVAMIYIYGDCDEGSAGLSDSGYSSE